MSIWISNKFVKFHVKRLNRSKNIPIIKVLGGLLFLNTLYVPYYVSRRFTVSRAQTITSACNNLQGDTFPAQLKVPELTSQRASSPVALLCISYMSSSLQQPMLSTTADAQQSTAAFLVISNFILHQITCTFYQIPGWQFGLLVNGTIFNDLEWPLTHISRSR